MSDSPRGVDSGALMAVLVGALLALGTAGCSEESPQLTPEEGYAVAQVAEPAADELLRTLVGQLTVALEERGVVGAVDFCSDRALPLTRTVQGGLAGGLELKRTSFRVRNPALIHPVFVDLAIHRRGGEAEAHRECLILERNISGENVGMGIDVGGGVAIEEPGRAHDGGL